MKLSKIAKTTTGSIWTWDNKVNVVPASVFTVNPKAKGWFLKAGTDAEIEIVEFFNHSEVSFNTLAEVKAWLKTSSFTLGDDTSSTISKPKTAQFVTEEQREEFFKDWSTAKAHPEDIAEGMIA